MLVPKSDRTLQKTPPIGPSRKDEKNRERLILWALFTCYITFLVVLGWRGYFFSLGKTIIIPALILFALLTRRFGAFVKEWFVFLSLTILFDSLRGLAFYLVAAYDKKLYMNYVIRWEEFLIGEKPIATILQEALLDPPMIGLFEKIIVVIHGSHFIFFLMMGVIVWWFRRIDFPKYTTGLIIVMGLGIVGYFSVPTVPPWMAANTFHVLEPIERIIKMVYSVHVPQLNDAFDTNPVGAMPSLHAAFPTFVTMASFSLFPVRYAFLVLVYTFAVMFGIAYSGEHYIVDILFGILIALVSYWVVFWSPLRTRLVLSRSGNGHCSNQRDKIAPEFWSPQIRQTVCISLLILLAAEGIGQFTAYQSPQWLISKNFIKRELIGKSDTANFYLGLHAYNEGDTETTEHAFSKAVQELPPCQQRWVALLTLSEITYSKKDLPGAIDYLKQIPIRYLTPQRGGITLVTAYARTGHYDEAANFLEYLTQRYPEDALVQHWRAQLSITNGKSPDPGSLQSHEGIDSNALQPAGKNIQDQLHPIPLPLGEGAKAPI